MGINMESSTELIKEKMDLEQEIIDIEARLSKVKAKARTSGVFADPEWFNKTTHKLNKKRLQLKKVNITLSELRKTEAKERQFDTIDAIMSGNFNRKSDKELVGVYLKPHLKEKLNELGDKGGRGTQSWIVNEALEIYFANKGLEIKPKAIGTNESA